MGREYVLEHCVAEQERRFEEKAYRVYTSEVLKSIAETLGVKMYKSYTDIINRIPEDTRTGDEIALDIITRAGLKGQEDDSSGINSQDRL